jgi:hypothetical protein
MATTHKASAIARELFDRLSKRLTLAITEGVGTDGDPIITIGTGASASASALIRIVPKDWPLAKDSLGNAATIFGPHKVQLATEANPSAGAGADNLSRQQLTNILGECLSCGCQTEWYEEAFGTGPDETTIDAANLKATYADIYHPLAAQ